MFVSCTQENSQNEVFDIGFDIFVTNNKGESLLSASTPNAINPDSVKLIYLINGAKFNVYNSNLDCPTSVCYVNEFGREYVGITPNIDENETYPITYVNWGNGDLDTIKCHFVRKDNGANASIVCDTVWFNNILMIPDNAIAGFERAFKITK